MMYNNFEFRVWIDKNGNTRTKMVLTDEAKKQKRAEWARARKERGLSGWMTYAYESDIYAAYEESKGQYCY